MNLRCIQKGISLVELMVGLTVGLIIVAGAMTFFSSHIVASYNLLGSSKVQQELNALMLVMTNDIRRAGYWGSITSANVSQIDTNPFSQAGSTALEVHDDMTSDINQVNGSGDPNATGSCVVYSYDATYKSGNTNGVDNGDLFGFRLNNGVVQMRQVGDTGGTVNSCGNGTWADVTDAAVINVTGLVFDLRPSQCLNTAEPNGLDDDGDSSTDEADEYDCYTIAPSSGDATVEVRQLTITLNGQLAGDASSSASITQTVKIRNDMVRVR